MKINIVALLIPVALANLVLAEQVTVSFHAFGDPTTFSITEGSTLNLRVSEQVPAPGSNSSTHILIDGLSPLEDGTQVYASPYRGINVGTGEEQDVGVLFLEMPEGGELPEGTISSPIVGVVQRAGSWGDYTLVTPTTSLGGASGASDISAGGDYIEAQLTRGSEAFSGMIPYTVVDENTIDIGDFTLVKDGTTSIDLSGATLLREGDRYYGTVTNLSDMAAYDALLYGIELSGMSSGGLPLGKWTQIEIGWVYGLTSEWGISTYMSYVYVPFMPYVYQVNLGWLYLSSSNGTQHVLYDWELGWIITDEAIGGWYNVYATGEWFQFSNPQP